MLRWSSQTGAFIGAPHPTTSDDASHSNSNTRRQRSTAGKATSNLLPPTYSKPRPYPGLQAFSLAVLGEWEAQLAGGPAGRRPSWQEALQAVVAAVCFVT